MKIAVVTSYPECESRPNGGVEAVSVHLTNALASDSRDDVHVVTFVADLKKPSVVESNKVTIHRLPRPQGSELSVAIGSGQRMMSDYVSRLKPDIVHSHDTYGLMVAGLPLPGVFTIHGFIHGDILVSKTRLSFLRSSIWRFFETRGWREKKSIISISPYVRERLGSYFSGRIYDIDNPISPYFFSLTRRIEPGTIFCAAAICERKNQLGLAKALNVLRRNGIDAKLRLAGAVTESSYGQKLARYLELNDLADHVSMLGRIGTEGISRELESASVFALVSREENSPMGIEEAMAVGLPVVTSNICGMPYMVVHGESGFLVDQEDPIEIAERLGEILSGDNHTENFGQVGRSIAEHRFHAATVARKTRAVYAEIVGRGQMSA